MKHFYIYILVLFNLVHVSYTALGGDNSQDSWSSNPTGGFGSKSKNSFSETGSFGEESPTLKFLPAGPDGFETAYDAEQTEEEPVPIDGGTLLLLIGGAALGVNKLRQRKSFLK